MELIEIQQQVYQHQNLKSADELMLNAKNQRFLGMVQVIIAQRKSHEYYWDLYDEKVLKDQVIPRARKRLKNIQSDILELLQEAR